MSNAPPSLGQYAEAYDQPFCGSPIRREVWQIADRIFSRGMRLVDIGCGTGEDAIHFARRGIDVTAIDVSPAMIAQVKLKSGGSVRCKLADMRTCAVEDIFDGVFSNFSAPNYVPDLDWLGQIRLTAGAHLVFTTLGRFYPLESAVFTFKGQPCRAFRRFKPSVRGEINGENFDVYYHSLRKILNALGRGVHLKKVLGLRALRPHARAGAPRAIRSSQCCQTNGSLVVFPPPDGRARGSIRFRMADA
ncbi:MAG: hypothetical protein DMG16_10175 [Acidobacteria bacterium]|nr:MAG: hypothetical protein DMG16_10175 [Acidobacteriota bacterium]